MFQFSGSTFIKLCIHSMITGLYPVGFPHSEICGSTSICDYPQLIAACHVLLRLLMPRHSPYALFSLTFDPFELCSSFLFVFSSFRWWFRYPFKFFAFLAFSHLNSYLSFANYMFNFQGAFPLTYLVFRNSETLQSLKIKQHDGSTFYSKGKHTNLTPYAWYL